MLFHGPYELPSATLHHASVRGTFQRWLAVQWAWLRPRSIPVAVAFLGLLGVMAATSYLTNFAHASRVIDPSTHAAETIKWGHDGHLVYVTLRP